MSRLVKLPVANVIVGDRHRADLGDIDALARSIVSVGLLQPIVVDERHRLIAGHRRLEAWRQLHGQKVPIDAYVIDTVDSARLHLMAERDENICRKNFAPSEAYALGQALEAIEKPRAKERQSASGGAEPGPVTVTGPTGNVRDLVGEAVGMSGVTYDRIKVVVMAAEDPTLPEPVREVAREALEEMDRTGQVSPAARKVAKAKIIYGTPDKSRAAVEARRQQIAELASSGHSRGQVAKIVGIDPKTVSDVARTHGIAFPADAATQRTRNPESNRIVESTVTTLEGLADTIGLIDVEQLDRERLQEWTNSLAESLRSLKTLKDRLTKELSSVES